MLAILYQLGTLQLSGQTRKGPGKQLTGILLLIVIQYSSGAVHLAPEAQAQVKIIHQRLPHQTVPHIRGCDE